MTEQVFNRLNKIDERRKELANGEQYSLLFVWVFPRDLLLLLRALVSS